MALALSGALALGCTQEDKTIVKVDGGKILGVETSIEGVYAFKGVPYAAPPIGNLRWKEPQPVIPWDGVRPAEANSSSREILPSAKTACTLTSGLRRPANAAGNCLWPSGSMAAHIRAAGVSSRKWTARKSRTI